MLPIAQVGSYLPAAMIWLLTVGTLLAPPFARIDDLDTGLAAVTMALVEMLLVPSILVGLIGAFVFRNVPIAVATTASIGYLGALTAGDGYAISRNVAAIAWSVLLAGILLHQIFVETRGRRMVWTR